MSDSIYIYNHELFRSPPKCICFDLDNTLYPYDTAHTAAMDSTVKKAVKLLDIQSKTFTTAFTQAREQIKQQLGQTASSHSRLLYLTTTIELLGFRTQPLLILDLEQTYWHTFLRTIRLFDGVKEFLAAIHRAGILTCLITDLTAQIQYRKVLFLELESFFHFIVTSEESGQDKPHTNSFILALKKTCTSPRRTWMIGDSLITDIEGASNAGLTTLWYSHTTKIKHKKPDLAFSTFIQLHRFMKKHGWIVS